LSLVLHEKEGKTRTEKKKTRRGGGTSESVFTTTTTITGPHTRSRRLRNHLLELCVNSDRHPSSASFATISAVRNGSCLQRTIIVALQHDILSRPTRHGSPTSTSSVRFRAWGQVRIKCVKIINIYWACVLLQNGFFDLFEIICLSLLILMDVIGFVVGINCDSGRLHVKHTVKKKKFLFCYSVFALISLRSQSREPPSLNSIPHTTQPTPSPRAVTQTTCTSPTQKKLTKSRKKIFLFYFWHITRNASIVTVENIFQPKSTLKKI